MAKSFQFDAAYYQRFYKDPETRVSSQLQVDKLAAFVAALLRYLDLPVRHVLDAGCGLGFWGRALAREFPSAHYEGIEVSAYLCERYGWRKASIVDFKPRTRADLVICQGVLQYLNVADAHSAVESLASCCRGALYLEALTRDDWDSGVADQERTDGATYLRSARWYRRKLAPHFVHVGGGVWLSHKADVPLYALERA